jgi:hypothetical protein
MYCWPTPLGQETDAVLRLLNSVEPPVARFMCPEGVMPFASVEWKHKYGGTRPLHVWVGGEAPEWRHDVRGVILWIGPQAVPSEPEADSLWPPLLGTWHSGPTTPLTRTAADAHNGVLLEVVEKLSKTDIVHWSKVLDVAKLYPEHDWIAYTSDDYFAGLLRLWLEGHREGGKPVIEYVACDPLEKERTGPRLFALVGRECVMPKAAKNPILICWQNGCFVPALNMWTCLFTWAGTYAERILASNQ